jgi:pimeloyl-ACP methyl ester carboxylesterase
LGAVPTSNLVQTSDLRVHYLQEGVGSPVVFLHGFPETSHQWRHQLPALAAAGFAAFAPDNRGFGRTDKPGARVSRSLLADDVIRFLDAVGIERCALVGHDWGGIIAFKAAVDHPERIERLALLDTLCTVWSPAAVHGWWFKVEGLAEEFFERLHREFIEVILGGRDAAVLGARPENPWPIPAGERSRPEWISTEDLAHYVHAFDDPDCWRHAISYYRYALPFHRVLPDTSSAHGERFESLSESQVAAMWLHDGGLEAHPWHGEELDYGPEDRHKRYPNPALWLYGRSRLGAPREGRTKVPSGNPFVDQFSRYLLDLQVHEVPAGHFVGEEAPVVVNDALVAFLREPR